MFGLSPKQAIPVGTRVILEDPSHHQIAVLLTRYTAHHPVGARINDPIPAWPAHTLLDVSWTQPLGLAHQTGRIVRCTNDFVYWRLQGRSTLTNRRQYPRYAIQRACWFGLPDPTSAGMTVDISFGGVQWQTPEGRWRIHDTVLFRMDLPIGSFFGSVQIIRRDPLKDYDAWRYAGMFHSVGAVERDHLQRFLAQFAETV